MIVFKACNIHKIQLIHKDEEPTAKVKTKNKKKHPISFQNYFAAKFKMVVILIKGELRISEDKNMYNLDLSQHKIQRK